MKRRQNLNLAHSPVPRKLWTYWHQGWRSAPPVVRRCLKSFQELNPEWEVHPLDAITVKEYLPPEELTPVESWPHFLRSDRIRLALLRLYGGVWADATVLFRAGLNDWLPPVPKDGFFTFVNRNPDRIEYWFLASHPGSFMIESLWRAHLEFFAVRRVHRARGRLWRLQRLLEKYLDDSHQRSVLWARWPLNRFPAYPYLIFCYLADGVVKANRQLPSLWSPTGFPDAEWAIKMTVESRRKGEITPDRIETLIRTNLAPVYKLSHHLGQPEFWRLFLQKIDQ